MQALRLSGVKLDQRAATERHCVHRLRCRRVGRHQISFEPGLRSDSRLCEARTTNTAKREDCGYDMETWQYLPNKRNKRSETQEFPALAWGEVDLGESKITKDSLGPDRERRKKGGNLPCQEEREMQKANNYS